MRAAAVLIVLATLAAGCGGEGEETAPPAPTARETAAETVRSRRAERPHPPSSESSLRFLRSRQQGRSVNLRLTEAARAVLPTDIEVWCWDDAVWSEAERRLALELGEDDGVTFAGIADQHAHHIHLAGWVCSQLQDLRTGSGEDISRAEALNILAHETRHFSPSGSDEAATECAGLQRMAELGVLLGATEEYGDELAQIAWEEIYPTLLEEYRSDECRPGGLLDREPETPEFP